MDERIRLSSKNVLKQGIKMLLDKLGVKSYLPHRDPFLFIDKVVSVTLPEEMNHLLPPFPVAKLIEGKVHCQFFVHQDLEILKGHFPGNPIMPGVIQVEMMAQAASFLCFKAKPPESNDKKIEVALLGVDAAKFRKPIFPNMLLDIYSTLKKARGNILSFNCDIYCKNVHMSQVEILASIKY